MNIEILLSTKERVRILSDVIYKAGEISVSSVARQLGLSKGLVSKYLDLLSKEGVLKRAGSRFVVLNSIQTKALRLLLNLNSFSENIFRRHRFVRSAGLYGSLVKGTNTEESDIDLWLSVEKTGEEKLAGLTAELRTAFGDVKPLYLTKEKIHQLKKADIVFYYSLIFGSIVIYGDGIEAL